MYKMVLNSSIASLCLFMQKNKLTYWDKLLGYSSMYVSDLNIAYVRIDTFKCFIGLACTSKYPVAMALI